MLGGGGGQHRHQASLLDLVASASSGLSLCQLVQGALHLGPPAAAQWPHAPSPLVRPVRPGRLLSVCLPDSAPSFVGKAPALLPCSLFLARMPGSSVSRVRPTRLPFRQPLAKEILLWAAGQAVCAHGLRWPDRWPDRWSSTRKAKGGAGARAPPDQSGQSWGECGRASKGDLLLTAGPGLAAAPGDADLLRPHVHPDLSPVAEGTVATLNDLSPASVSLL